MVAVDDLDPVVVGHNSSKVPQQVEALEGC